MHISSGLEICFWKLREALLLYVKCFQLCNKIPWLSQEKYSCDCLSHELATFFMGYHLAWKEWLANYGYSDLVFGRHFHKNERSELAISRKTNDGFVVDDNIWILKQKLEFWKVIFSTTSFLTPSVSRLLMWLVVILKKVIWGYGVRRWVNIRRSAKLSWTNIFPMANPWCKNMND